eukprot:jgi/Hompol1/2913/HPOL_006225-RA
MFDHADNVTLEVARVVIALQCLVAGITTPGNYLVREWKSMAILLGPVMIYMWLASALLIWAIFDIPWLMSLVIAACVTPTDPVLASSIVQGKFAEKHIPIHVRLLLSAESAANDGLGVPFIFLPIYLYRIANTTHAVGWWFLNVFMYQILLSVVVGGIIGFICRKSLQFCHTNGWIDKYSMLGFFVSVTLLTTGSLSLLGIDDVFGCFVVGTVLSWDQWYDNQIAESHTQEVVDLLINMTFFTYVGTLIPWAAYGSAGTLAIWQLVLLAVGLLLFRRLPIVMLLYNYIPAIETPREAFFAGWFGPIGAGAIFYAMIAVVYLDVEEPKLVPIVYFVVLSSIIMHGFSVSLFHMGIKRIRIQREQRQHRERLRTETLHLERITTENSAVTGFIRDDVLPVDGFDTLAESTAGVAMTPPANIVLAGCPPSPTMI